MNSSKRSGIIMACLIALSGCAGKSALHGTWQYSGGIYNGKKEGGTEGYKLQREYKDKNFEAFMIEDGSAPQRFQAGDFELKGDSCFETETYSAQTSTITGVTLRYAYKIKNDTLILNGRLPSGMVVEEYWKKLK